MLAPVLRGAGVKNKVLEPLAAGRPVVATPEAVIGLGPEVTAHLTVAPAEPAAFAAAIVSALDTAPPVDRLAQGREAVRPWTWDVAVAALERVLVAAESSRLRTAQAPPGGTRG